MASPIDVALADHSVVQPDVIYVESGTFGDRPRARSKGRPDLVVEALSHLGPGAATSARSSVFTPKPAWLEYWIVDPVQLYFSEFLV